MSRIAVIGGHGKVALHLTRILSEEGQQVSSFFRNPAHIDDVAETGAEPVVADVENLSVEEIADLLTGHHGVVWSAGAGGGDPERTYAVDRDAAIRTMDAAAQAGAKRFVMVSYFNAGPDHGVPEDQGFFHYAEAKAAADAYLRGTDLEWTILGPSGLTDEPGVGTIETGDGVVSGTVPREDVARVAAAVLGEPTTAGRTLNFNTGATPISEVVSPL